MWLVLLLYSSNDAFTNQHSLIPPSFGGPQIHVALPRVADVAPSESVTAASPDSQSTTRTIMSSELDVAEMGHDVVKDLFSDGLNYQQPEELMSAAEQSSISAAGAGFDAALRRASSTEAGEMCNKQHCIGVKYVDASAAAESSDSLRNGHAACNTTWHLLNPGLGRVASDSSIASSVGSLVEGSSMDISGLVCRTAAVAGHSSFKTHALTERSLNVGDTVSVVDDSNVSLTDRLESHDDDDDDGPAAKQHSVSECNVVARSDNVMQEHCLK